MKRIALSACALLAAGLLGGCVERRFVISSEPPGAAVYREGQLIGQAPVDDYFVYYGAREYTLVLPGYETLKVRQPAPPPWFEYPPLDFFAENVWPFKIRDVRQPPPYQLRPLQTANPNQVLQRATQLRERGKTLGPPPGSEQPAAAPVPVAPPMPPASP
jgi:hypothetical protein